MATLKQSATYLKNAKLYKLYIQFSHFRPEKIPEFFLPGPLKRAFQSLQLKYTETQRQVFEYECGA